MMIAGQNIQRRSSKYNGLRVGSWNVLSLYRSGALKNLIGIVQEYNIDILAIQEIRWMGQSMLEKKEGNIYYSCRNKLHQFGTGFIVSKKSKHLVIDFQLVKWRLCKLRIKGRFHNYSIICIHAPTEEKSEDEKNSFYDLFEKEYKCPKSDIKLILGDFNAKIGQENTLMGIIGQRRLHKDSNDNGMRVIGYAASRNMVIGSTMFSHKEIHKATWKSPDGRTFNQIDYVLIDARHRSNLIDVRS
jgi:hypothetical protein